MILGIHFHWRIGGAPGALPPLPQPKMFSISCSFYRPQRSCGKVMFSQASVILFTGGVSQHALGRPPGQTPLPPWQTPRIYSPLFSACWDTHTTPLPIPTHPGGHRTVRILLECILSFFLTCQSYVGDPSTRRFGTSSYGEPWIRPWFLLCQGMGTVYHATLQSIGICKSSFEEPTEYPKHLLCSFTA